MDLGGKCGTCRHYKQLITDDVLTARGHCLIKNKRYKQRTETCKKYKERGFYDEQTAAPESGTADEEGPQPIQKSVGRSEEKAAKRSGDPGHMGGRADLQQPRMGRPAGKDQGSERDRPENVGQDLQSVGRSIDAIGAIKGPDHIRKRG